MNRRLFVGQLSVGLALPFVPASVIAGSSSSLQSNNQLVLTSVDKAAELVRSGLIGIPERMTISHVYTPQQVSTATLLAMAERDVKLAGRLMESNLAIDARTIFNDSPSVNFGSYSSRFDRDDVVLVWQALARIGTQAGTPTDTLRLFGSSGILEMDLNKPSFQLINFQGRVVRAEKQAGNVANCFTRRSFLNV